MTQRRYDGVTAYRRAKLAQVMATYDLAGDLVGSGRHRHRTAPGDAHGHRDGPRRRPAPGEHASSRASSRPGGWWPTSRSTGSAGLYFDGLGEGRTDPQADDPAARAWVRALSDSLIADALTSR